MKLVVDSIEYIASARDVGNFAAGYISGRNYIPWENTRWAFDLLETISQKHVGLPGKHVEGQPSQLAQKIGYDIGVRERNLIETFRSYRSIYFDTGRIKW